MRHVIPWTRQPQCPAKLDRSNPFARSLKHFWTQSIGSTVPDLAGNKWGTFGTTTSNGGTPNGLAFKASGATSNNIALLNATPTAGNNFTFFGRLSVASLSGDQRFYSSANNNGFSFFVNATGKISLATRYGTVIGASTGSLSTNVMADVAVTWDGTTAYFYINGFASGTGTTVPASYNLGANYTLLGDGDGDPVRSGGLLQHFGIYDRILSDQEIYRLSTNPWQLLAPLVRESPTPVAAVGGEGSGSGISVATGSGVGASLFTSLATGTAVTTGSAVGASLFTSSGTGTGVATGLGVGESLFEGVGTGVSVATGTGIAPSIVTSEGSGTSVSTGLGVGESTGGEEYFGGGGYPVYGKFVRPKSIKDILDLAMEDIYEEATKKNVPQETRLEFAKVIKPYTESKAKVPDTEKIDWAALQKDAKRVEKLLELWQQQLNDDDQVILMAYEEFY